MILCCGEALIDMIPSSDAKGRAGFVPHAGGAVFNTAIALGRLGQETGFVSGISRDLFGVQLFAALEAAGVDGRHVIRSDLPTTLAFVELTEGQARYTFYDENTAGRSLTPSQVPQLGPDVDALYFGGISLISEPCAEFYAAFAEEQAPHRTIMLDPNVRPAFVQDAARYRARLQRMIGLADIVKVSDEDLDWIVTGTGDLPTKAAALSEMGPNVVIVTKGAQGAWARLPDGTTVEVAAPRVEMVDTVGAGDTFNAGVLAKLAQLERLKRGALTATDADALRTALSLGAAVAAVTVSRAGADPPWAREL